jgi:hypothetical protein
LFCFKTYLCLKIITDEFIANNYRTSLGKQSFVTRRDNKKAIREVIELDAGKLRVAEPKGDAWQVNEWVKKQLLCIFLSRKWKHGKLEF